MDSNFPRRWMWSEAFEMLARAEQLHREIFRPTGSALQRPAWEPPMDVLETERAVLMLVALPGVNPSSVEISIEETVPKPTEKLGKQSADHNYFSGARASTRAIKPDVRAQLKVSAARLFWPARVIE